ncbi:MAG: APC family permease [Thermoleophilia bacterium]
MAEKDVVYDIDALGVDKLKKDAIGLGGILFAALAGAAPIAAMMFNTPFAAQSAGPTVPLVYLTATIGLVLLSVGMVDFARRFSAAGGFYSFISHGLGRTWGFASGWMMMIGYSMFEAALVAAFGVFSANQIAAWGGPELPWWILAAVAIFLGWFVSLRGIHFSTNILGFLMIIEVLSLGILSLVIFFKGGVAGHSLAPFNPFKAVGGFGGFGFALTIGVWSWIGFEAAANYAEESRDPRKNVPRALYLSVIMLGVFYIFVTYSATIGYGVANAVDGFGGHPDDAYFVLADQFAKFTKLPMEITILTGSFACGLAFHNAMVRYFYAMGREGILPRIFGRTSKSTQSPHMAIHGQSILTTILLVGFLAAGVSGLDMYYYLAQIGTYGFMGVFVLCNLAVIRYFTMMERESFNIFRHLIAPVVSSAVFVIAIYEFIVTAAPGTAYVWFPYLVLGFFLVGMVFALYIRAKAPERFEVMGRLVRAAE